MTDNDEDDLINVISPIIYISGGYLFAILIFLGGIIISINLHDWSWFSRSGSLLVVIALTLEVIDFPTWISNISKSVRKYSERDGDEFLYDTFRNIIKENLKKHGVIKSPEEIEFLTEQYRDNYLELLPTKFGSGVKKMAHKYEIIIAAIGTLIWGFGDLINHVF